MLWGSETHLRELFGDRVRALELTRKEYVERASSPRAYCEFFRDTFGPVVGLRASMAAEPDRLSAFDQEFLDWAVDANEGRPGRPAEYPYEYLLVIARVA